MKTVPLLDQISAATVTAKHLEAMNREAQEMRVHGATEEGATVAAMRVFGTDASAVTMVAAIYRMQAMCALAEAGALEAWTRSHDADGAYLSKEVFSAAALTPLRLSRKGKRRVWFDRKEFVEHMLRGVAPEGRA